MNYFVHSLLEVFPPHAVPLRRIEDFQRLLSVHADLCPVAVAHQRQVSDLEAPGEKLRLVEYLLRLQIVHREGRPLSGQEPQTLSQGLEIQGGYRSLEEEV